MTTTMLSLMGIGLSFFANQVAGPAAGARYSLSAAVPASAPVVAAQVPAQAAPKAKNATPSKALPSAPPANVEVEALIDKMQQVYKDSRSFVADFEQTYHNVAFGRSERSQGKISYLRPGRMRFDYSAPSRKSFVVDGQALWVVQTEDKQAMVDRCFKSDALTSSLTFLFGQGDLRAQFLIQAAAQAPAGQLRLLLDPKKAQGAYQKLILDVDAASGRVVASTVVDHQGNLNRFAFSHAKYNGAADAKQFAYQPPKDFAVMPIPGSCIKR